MLCSDAPDLVGAVTLPSSRFLRWSSLSRPNPEESPSWRSSGRPSLLDGRGESKAPTQRATRSVMALLDRELWSKARPYPRKVPVCPGRSAQQFPLTRADAVFGGISVGLPRYSRSHRHLRASADGAGFPREAGPPAALGSGHPWPEPGTIEPRLQDDGAAFAWVASPEKPPKTLRTWSSNPDLTA